MAMIDGLPSVILEAIAARLRSQLSVAEPLCFISDNPDETPPSAGEIYYIVSPAPKGTFDSRCFDGGGQGVMTVNTMIIVTVHSSSQRDEPGRAKEMFTHANSGLFLLAKPVLKALAGWAPDASSDIIVNQPLFPDNYAWYRPSRDNSSFQVAFHLQFDWDMS